MTEASLPRPILAAMAAVISLIISPACRATTVAPKISPVPFRVVNFHKALLLAVADGAVHFTEGRV